MKTFLYIFVDDSRNYKSAHHLGKSNRKEQRGEREEDWQQICLQNQIVKYN